MLRLPRSHAPRSTVCSTLAIFDIPGNFFSLNDTGFLGGGQIGYNAAFGNLVAGVELDIAYTSISTTTTFLQPFPCCVRDTFMHQELQSLSTMRARLGYAFDNIRLYATGGLAVGQVSYSLVSQTRNLWEVDWPPPRTLS